MKYWGIAIILSLVACSASSTQLPLSTETTISLATSETKINWWTTWLAQPACKPPCWQNITPGITTFKEAISILENTSGIKITFKSKDGLDWEFSKDEGGTLGASQNGIVDMIWIGSVSDRKLLLKSIVASYDYPQYVKPYDCREGMCLTALVYTDLGMFLSVFIENTGTGSDWPQIEILPDTIVDRVYFIEPGLKSFLSDPEFQESDLLMEWKGYDKYP